MSIRKRTRKSYGVGQSKLHIKSMREFCRYEEYRKYMSQYEWLYCYTEYEWYMFKVIKRVSKIYGNPILKSYLEHGDGTQECRFYTPNLDKSINEVKEAFKKKVVVKYGREEMKFKGMM